MPQNRFASIHVVGTNGKTSVTRTTAALLEAHGVTAGAYVSPHISSWRERILIHGEPISDEAFDAAVERAEQAAQVADRSAGDEGPVTQFELLTAAAFVAFAEARVAYVVVEAGLGGRLDATNVIPSKLTVLTSVGLDHTEYLGETLEEIAAEKLAVLRDHTTLVHGEVPREVEPVIDREVERAHANQVRPEGGFVGGGRPGDPFAPSLRGFQASNVALASTAAWEALQLSEPVDPGAVIRAIAGVHIPGRAEVFQGDPPQIFDAAHNPDGARALFELLPELTDGREIVCCLAVLEEKDAAGIVEALAPAISYFVSTEVPPEAIVGSGRPGGHSHPAPKLADLCRQAGVEAEAVPGPIDAWRRARELAEDRGGIALAAGSHYLLSSIWTERHAASS
ncbi:MAG: bifunctional folylpolyglutamate synthase/dihydrofolate synthase [Solirubrobacterales bacterium]